MKAIISGIVISLVIAVVASFALSEAQRPAYERYSTSSVRIGNPGHNLVGNWSSDDLADTDS